MESPVAVVGISAELPSGNTSAKNLDFESFSRFLLDGGEAYETFPEERLNIDAWKGLNQGQIHVENGAFLKDIDHFDNVEFGISNKVARTMAPSTRKLIEHAFLALLDSGIDYRSRDVGCFMSGVIDKWTEDEYNFSGSFSNVPAMTANRVSYHLDLRGPSVPSNTACSASCTALHLAVNALLREDCESAVVGGCQLNHEFIDWFQYSQGSLLAKDGKCKPFDASADGFSRAEGVVVIVIKSLEKAIQDGDHIYGTILGTAINAGGSAAPPNAPIAEAQRRVMIKAFERAGRSPKEVSYVECHATGTAQGDPAEANWVGYSFGQRDKEVLIGSVKGNIGHTEVASFLVSLCKVLTIFRHRVIPPNVNLSVPNPAIHWDAYNMRAPMTLTRLIQDENPILVAIASSGIGGANAHAVVECPPPTPLCKSLAYPCSKPVLLMAGGLSPRSAALVAESVSNAIVSSSNDLRLLAVQSGRKARQMTWRSFAVVDANNLPESSTFPSPEMNTAQPHVVFVFSGQGPQYGNMGRELFQTFPVFRSSIEASDGIYTNATGKSLIEDYHLFGRECSVNLPEPWPITVTLPSLVVFQIAIYDLLKDIGVIPDSVVGHSAGETALIYASGAGTRSMAIELAVARATAFASIECNGGTMAALACGPRDAEAFLGKANVLHRDVTHSVDIACYNSPSAVAIAGPEVTIDEVIQLARAQDIPATKIRTRVPVHSSMIEDCGELYRRLTIEVFERDSSDHRPSIPVYSTTIDTISSMIKQDPSTIFIEISPHPVLSAYLTHMTSNPKTVLNSARRPRRDQVSQELRTFLTMVGQLTVAGYNKVDFMKLHNIGRIFLCTLDASLYRKQTQPHRGPLNHDYLRLNKATHPSLADHIILGEAIMPAAGFLGDLDISTLLSLSSEKPLRVNTKLDGCHWYVESRSEHNDEGQLHAEGYLTFTEPDEIPNLDIDSIRVRCDQTASSNFYPSLAYAYNYGSVFQRVEEVYYGRDEALARIRGSDSVLDHDKYLLHPAILDACFHVTCFRSFHGNLDPNIYTLPSHIQSVQLHQPLKEGKWRPDGVVYDINVVDVRGRFLCTIKEFERFDLALVSTSLPAGTPKVPSPLHICPSDIHANKADLVLVPFLDTLKQRIREDSTLHPKRVLNFFLSGDKSHLQTSMSAICQAFPEIYVKYFLNGGKEFLQLPSSMTTGRIGTMDFDNPVEYQGLEESSFDVIILTDTPSSTATSVIASVSKLLIPGGYTFLFLGPLPSGATSSTVNKLEKDLLATNTTICSSQECGLDDGSYMSIVAQYHPSMTGPPLFDNEKSLRFAYRHGDEIQLQRYLAQLNLSSPYDIWITAEEGRDGDEATGLVRVLQREFPAWSIRVATHETEICFSREGNPFVPRLVSVPSPNIMRKEGGEAMMSSDDCCVRIRVLHYVSHSGGIIAFSGTISSGNTPFASPGTIVVGITDKSPSEEYLVVDQLRVARIPDSTDCKGDFGTLLLMLPGLVVAALVPSLITFGKTERFKQHLPPDVPFLGIKNDVDTFELLQQGERGQFDLIITGHTDLAFLQIAQLLLKKGRGKLFSWSSGSTALKTMLSTEPWSISDALYAGLDIAARYGISTSTLDPQHTSRSLFRSDRLYVLLGGIGSLGPHIALWMYQHGARYILMTSRLGTDRLRVKANQHQSRIIEYLRSRRDLNLRLERSDASNKDDLHRLLSGARPELGGCFILTAYISDRIFLNTSEEDFYNVRRATSDVLQAFLNTVDTTILDFLVVFSSVSALFGNPGQANYSCAKSFADGLIRGRNNAFSFVCPPIANTSLLAGARRIATWNVSVREMLQWLEDGINMLQSGQDFWLYIPNFDWSELTRTIGETRLIRHLVQSRIVPSDVNDKLVQIIVETLEISPEDLSFEVPLTTYGLDSLSASRLAFALEKSVKVNLSQIPTSVGEDVRNMLLDRLQLVLLTGATGAIGSHILSQLIASPNVASIYVMTRASDTVSAIARQNLAFDREGISLAASHETKAVFLPCNFTEADFGLLSADIDKISSNVATAWHSDFTAPLSAYDELLQETHNLLSLAMRSKEAVGPKVVFISTTGVCSLGGSPSAAIEERIPFENLGPFQGAALPGYVQSKWIAEEMVNCFGENTGLRTSIIRVGQVAGGPYTGAWNTSQWVPGIVGTFHVVHPHPVEWGAVLRLAASKMNVPVVAYKEWIRRLETDIDGNVSSMQENPALRLLDFFRQGVSSSSSVATDSMGLLVKVAMDRSLSVSSTLRDKNLRRLGEDDVDRWIGFWKKEGFLL
ncbi:putative polyketide synthase [Armillaria mellea]|nr:putative polyketide synthase [Armillaria mellea]